MNGFYVVCTLWISIQITGHVYCCPVNDSDSFDNGFWSCRANDSCEAKCYRGYMFPDGKTETNYSCKENQSISVASCKHIPVVIIKYVAVWEFHNVLPSNCENISTLLKPIDTFKWISDRCKRLAVDFNVTFNHSVQAFLVDTIFVVECNNFTSTQVLQTCVSLFHGQLKNETMPKIDELFDTIMCENEKANVTIFSDLKITNKQHCPIGTEVNSVNVTHDGQENIEYYCDKPSKTDSSRETNTVSQSFTSMFNSTYIYGNSTPEYSDTTFARKTYEPSKSTNTVSQNFTTVSNSTYTYDNSTTKYIDTTFARKTLYYVVGLAAGILVLLSLITVIVARCKTDSESHRFKATEEYFQDNEMAELEKSYGTSFKGILIENDFYQSADNVPIVSKDTGDYATALPYYKAESETNLTSDENHYSYAISSMQIDISCDVSKTGVKLKSDENHYSYANSTLHHVAEICNDAVQEETKEEQNSAETAVEEPIEMNEGARDSLQYTLIDKSFKTKN